MSLLNLTFIGGMAYGRSDTAVAMRFCFPSFFSPPTTLWPGFDSWTFCHKWVVSSHLCLKDFFLWVSVLYTKHHAKFQPCFLRDKHLSIFNQWLLPSINVHGVNLLVFIYYRISKWWTEASTAESAGEGKEQFHYYVQLHTVVNMFTSTAAPLKTLFSDVDVLWSMEYF